MSVAESFMEKWSVMAESSPLKIMGNLVPSLGRPLVQKATEEDLTRGSMHIAPLGILNKVTMRKI